MYTVDGIGLVFAWEQGDNMFKGERSLVRLAE
jgi:hypothetical protein